MSSNENGDVLEWYWDLVRFLDESVLKKEDGTFKKLSVVLGVVPKEVYIYLEKETFGLDYKVTVFKAKPEDKYKPYKYDKVKSVKETDKCTIFGFEDFIKARNFVDMLAYKHPEYQNRPERITD